VAKGDGTAGILYAGFRKAGPAPKKLSRPTYRFEEEGGDIATDDEAGGLDALGGGGEDADMGPPSVLNSAHRGHLRLVFI